MRSEDHGRKAGYVVDRSNEQVTTILGRFSALAEDGEDTGGRPGRPSAAEVARDSAAEAKDDQTADADGAPDQGDELTATEDGVAIAVIEGGTGAAPKRRTRGRRGGRGRRKPTRPEVAPGP